jgi:hypothetical protein
VIIQDISVQDASRVACEESNPSAEHYTIYLIRNNEPVPVQIEYQNLTSVKAPGITAIQLLLQTMRLGYENPFPQDSRLDLVRFTGSRGEIFITMTEKVSEGQFEKMRRVLEKTLALFGIFEVEIKSAEE